MEKVIKGTGEMDCDMAKAPLPIKVVKSLTEDGPMVNFVD